MPVVEGPPGAPARDAKRTFVQRLFTDIAPQYDWFNRLASLGLDGPWRRRAVASAQVHPGLRVVDVCTGTGDLAIESACRVGARGLVVGVDMNPAMLAHAARKRAARGKPMRWVLGDAQGLPFADNSVDRVMIGFSTRNLSDLELGLGEMVRVLRPEGRLVILETGRPRNRLLRWGYHAFLLTGARAIGWVLTGRCWPFTYLARSVRAFLSPEDMVRALERAGMRGRYEPLAGGLASLFVARKPSGEAA
ncbi:MAG TPA: ubiquinone/menaquinone biosynthesis methyltransferase [bacterium]